MFATRPAFVGRTGARRRTRRRRISAVVAGCLALGGCAPDNSTLPGTVDPLGAEGVVVASFNFPESVLLAEIYAQALEDVGLPVTRRHEVGPREMMSPALDQGLVDVVPEYLGSALAALDPGAAATTLDAAGIRARLEQLLSPRGVVAAAHAPAENQNGIVVTPQTATRLGLRQVSDLAPHAGGLAFGGPRECRDRPLCLAGLRDTYGLRFARFLPLDSGGPQTRDALRSGEVEVGLLFTTDGHLAQGDFVLLVDDRGLQPAENVVPLVRQEVVARWGDGLIERLDAVSAALDTETLAELNGEVSFDRETPAEVAADWLDDLALPRR